MSVFYMGFSLGDDLAEMKEELVVKLKDDIRESRNNGLIENVEINGSDFETEFDFWPIQHPTEPSREDRPVQCPMPHSSQVNNDDGMQDDQYLDCKIPEVSTVVYQENGALEATEPPIRAVRKRHHDHADTITPLLQTLPVYRHSFDNKNTTIFNKFQHVHKFKS